MKMNIQLFAGSTYNFKIYSNDGNTILFNSGHGSDSTVITVTSTGATGFLGDISDPDPTYTYSGQGTFRGFSGSPNSTTPDLQIGYSDTVQNIRSLIGVAEYESDIILYVVDVADVVEYEHILKDNHKIQVDSAIRDGNGLKIDTGYEKNWKTLVDTGILDTVLSATDVSPSGATTTTYKYDLSSIITSDMINTLLTAVSVRIHIGLRTTSSWGIYTSYVTTVEPSITKSKALGATASDNETMLSLGFHILKARGIKTSGFSINQAYCIELISTDKGLYFENTSSTSSYKLESIKIEYK